MTKVEGTHTSDGLEQKVEENRLSYKRTLRRMCDRNVLELDYASVGNWGVGKAP